jgi:hypothetical protein
MKMAFPSLHINNPILKRELEAAFAMLLTMKGNMYFVHSGTGSAYSAGTDIESPMATLDDAVNKCTANQGDIIIVLPGHAETITTASAIDIDIAGIKVYGIGESEDRPKITISTAADASIEFAANSTVFKNIILIGAKDGLTGPMLLKGVGLDIDVETRDSTNLLEATTWFLSEATCNHLKLKAKHIGFTDGSGTTSYIKLVGANYPRIKIDFFGLANTSVVEFSGTKAINAIISGNIYNEGDTTYAKFIVDTIGSSTWVFSGQCGENGTMVQGSQDVAIAGTDTSAIAAALSTIDAFHDVPSADSADNVVMSDVIGNKDDTVAGTSLVALVKQIYARTGAPAGASMSADIAAIKAVADTIEAASVTEIAEILAAVDAEIAQIIAALVIIDEFQDVPGIDSAANAQTNEVLGNKDDTVGGTSLVALIKQAIAALVVVDGLLDVPTTDLATNATINQVVGNKDDTVGGTSIVALAKQIIAALVIIDGLLDVPTQDLATDATINQVVGKKSDTVGGTSIVALIKQALAALVVVDGFHDVTGAADSAANSQIRDVVGRKDDTVAGDSIIALAKQIIADTGVIGTIVNAGGTATLGALLGDFANSSLVTRLGNLQAEVDKIGTVANTGGTATLGGVLGDLYNIDIATRLIDGIKKTVIADGTTLTNNTQVAAGLLATATNGDVLIEEICWNRAATNFTGPNNLEFTTDNVAGLTGVDAPVGVAALAKFNAATTNVLSLDGTTKQLPFMLESGKKLYIHGDDAAVGAGGSTTFTIKYKRMASNAYLA